MSKELIQRHRLICYQFAFEGLLPPSDINRRRTGLPTVLRVWALSIKIFSQRLTRHTFTPDFSEQSQGLVMRGERNRLAGTKRIQPLALLLYALQHSAAWQGLDVELLDGFLHCPSFEHSQRLSI